MDNGSRKELRLAVVCYGGVSLCIYMHGITKELHRLVRASRLPDDAAEPSTENVYRQMLACAAEDEPDIDVVVDVVSGTSAGGINGVYLAKALAHNLSQDALRDLWMERGDIGGLARGPEWVPLVFKAGPLVLDLEDAPLSGDRMCVWLHGALTEMDDPESRPATLMPEGHDLQLFVTMTDLEGYDRRLVLEDPPVAHDRNHRHVFEFRYDDGEDHFTPEHNPALTFAARATSSFPGAFPPISVAELRGILPSGSGDVHPHFFRVYDLVGAEAEQRFFVDGGVLDNRPFGRVVGAIRDKSADVQVDRKLLFLEPDPKQADTRHETDTNVPSPLATVRAAVVGVPRHQTILDQVLEINRLNERVRRVRDVVESNFDYARTQVRDIVGDVTEPNFDTMGKWQTALNDLARTGAGLTYPTYLRSKISGAVDGLAETFCAVCDFPPDTDHAFVVRASMRAWAERHDLFVQADGPTDAQIEFLSAFDLEYGIRRLQFVITGLNWLYEDEERKTSAPPRPQIDALKTLLWTAVSDLRETRSGRRFESSIIDDTRMYFPEGRIGAHVAHYGFDGFAVGAEVRLKALIESVRTFNREQLSSFTHELYLRVVELTKDWERDTRYDLMVRYLGFPLWDVMVHPVQAAGGAGERDNVEVLRMSPLDSHLLVAPDGEKLEGLGLGHFRAFFKRQYRENDYLWGRLDAAERLAGLVLGEDHDEFATWCGKAFLAILDEEKPALQTIAKLIHDLRQQAEAL